MAEDDRYTRITLRIPKNLHGKLVKSADARSHSMNAEIVQRLEESLTGPQWDVDFPNPSLVSGQESKFLSVLAGLNISEDLLKKALEDHDDNISVRNILMEKIIKIEKKKNALAEQLLKLYLE